MKAPFWKTPYNHDLDEESNKHTVKDFGPSLTIQSQAEEADINVLMHRYGITGRMPDNPRLPTYINLDEPLDFATALKYVDDAKEAFMEYPATLRAKFENNPQLFLEYTSNPANLEEMRSLGLAKPAQPATPAVATVPAGTNPAAPKPAT